MNGTAYEGYKNGVAMTDLYLSKDTIPEGVMAIDYLAFQDCVGLTEIILPEGVEDIGQYAFENCSSMTSVTIPKSVIQIGAYAFFGCIELTEVNYAGTEEEWEQIIISEDGNEWLQNADLNLKEPTGPAIIASGTCGAEGDNLTWTLDGDGLLTVSGEGEMAYYAIGEFPWSDMTDSIRSIALGSNVSSISHYAFEKCSNLTAVTIPKSITSIGSQVFYCCSSLIRVFSASMNRSSGTRGMQSRSALSFIRRILSMGRKSWILPSAVR